MTRYSARLIVFAEQDRVGRLLVGQPRPARTRNTGFRRTYAVNSASNDSISRTTTLYHLHSRASLRSEDLPSSTTGPSSVFDDISAIAYPLHHGPSSSVVGATPIADFVIHAIFSSPIHFFPQSPSTMLLIHSTPILPHSIPCSHRLSKLAPSLPDLSSSASLHSKSSPHRPL